MYQYQISINGQTWGNDDIGSPSLRKSAGGQGFSIGNVIIGAFTVNLPNGIPGNGHRIPYTHRAQVNFSANGMPLGTYFIAKRQESNTYAGENDSRITLTCYDRLAFSNQEFKFSDNQDMMIGFRAAAEYIAGKIGCTLDNPELIQGFEFKNDKTRTMREVLSLIASSSGGDFMMTMEDKLRLASPFINPIRHHTIPLSDRTIPEVGEPWEIQRVAVNDGTDEYTYGTGDDAHTLVVENDAASDEMADILYTNLGGYEYLPFSVERIKIPIYTELYDTVSIMEIESAAGKISRSCITNLALDFLPDTGYATLSASDGGETRDEFDFNTRKKLMKKGEKISTVSHDNRYGMKSVAKKKSQKSVGAAAATETHEARFDNAELSFRDISGDTPEDGGKIYLDTTDTENKSVNIAMKGLLTEAQDVRGAINELFQSGTNEWVRPDWWIPLPDPEPNQITMLMYITEEGQNKHLELFRATNDGKSENNLEATVDYGDGSSPETKNSGDSTILTFGINKEDPYYQPWAPGQYIVTITFHTLEKFYPIALYGNLIGYADERKKAILGLKVGSNISRVHCNHLPFAEELYFNCENMTEIEENSMNGLQTLRHLKLPSSIVAIGDSCFSGDRVLKHLYLPNLESIGKWCFQGSFSINEVNFPKLKTIGSGCFDGAFGIENIDLPELESMGNDCFDDPIAIRHINIPSTATIGTGCFSYLGYSCPPEERPI